MINYIWMALLVIGILWALITGKLDIVTKAVIESANEGLQLCITLTGIMCLWTGLMNVAKQGGLLKLINRALSPVFSFLFPKLKKGCSAFGAIAMNFTANFLGLGNAATPFGIKAMEELQRLNTNKNVASDEMIMFIAINTSCIQLIPTTVIALRQAAGSNNPTEIIVTVWFASLCATVTAIILCKLFSSYSKLR